MAATPVGKDVTVSIIRDTKPQDLTVKIARLEDADKKPDGEAKANPDVPPPTAVQAALGMQLSQLTDELRKKFGVKDTVKGVAVTDVNQGTPASDKGMKPGDVIVEINQEAVSAPADITLKVKAMKDAGKHSALLLVANAQGDVRFVALSLD